MAGFILERPEEEQQLYQQQKESTVNAHSLCVLVLRGEVIRRTQFLFQLAIGPIPYRSGATIIYRYPLL